MALGQLSSSKTRFPDLSRDCRYLQLTEILEKSPCKTAKNDGETSTTGSRDQIPVVLEWDGQTEDCANLQLQLVPRNIDNPHYIQSRVVPMA
jgi:hypothetical protein